MSFSMELADGAEKKVDAYSNRTDSQTYTIISFKVTDQKIVLEL